MHDSKLVRRLITRIHSLAHRQARDHSRAFWIDSVRPFLRAAESNQQIQAIVESEALNRHGLAQKYARALHRNGVPRIRVSPEVFRQISTTEHASGIGAIVSQPWIRPAEADPQRGLCWLAAESIRSPGNLGTILRTAEAVGAAGLWVLGDSVDPFDPACVRATMGGLFSLQFVRSPLPAFEAWCERHAITVVGLDAHAHRRWDELVYPKPLVLMIGNERKGLSTDVHRVCDEFAHLPMTGSADSLNVSVATSVVLYELVRRTGC